MSISTAKELTLKASLERYSVGAFNVTSLVQMMAVIEAHIDKKAPVIIQVSVAPSKFYGPGVLSTLYRSLAESAPIPICLHLDHCTDIEFCKTCAEAGYTNIMIDASKQSFEENIRQTSQVVQHAHQFGASVEGELGTVGGVEDQIKIIETEAELCNPDQVLEFVERTGVDLLAPAIGTAHGIYKTKNPKIDFERFAKINQILNADGIKTPLVVHGGTGLPVDTVKRLVSLGGAKFNVSTDLKHTLIDTTLAYLADHKGESEPGKLDLAVREATRTLVSSWIDLFGSEKKA
jgi:ketose-bisphosphate aldolase